MKNQSSVAGIRYDYHSGQYFPTINGIDTSPSSFDENRAREIAQEQIDKSEND